MWKVQACAACLATGVRMYDAMSSGLLVGYQDLTGLKTEELERVRLLCWWCAALVNKFSAFRSRCLLANATLQHIYATHDYVTTETIQEIKCDDLSLPLTVECVLSLDSGAEPSLAAECTPEQYLPIKEDDNEDRKTKTEMLDEEYFEVEYLEDLTDYEEVVETSARVPAVKNSEVMKEERSLKAAKPSRKRNKRTAAGGVEENCNRMFTKVRISKDEQVASVLRRQFAAEYARAAHRCDVCYEVFAQATLLQCHQMAHRTSSGDFECAACRLRYDDQRQLDRHAELAHAYRYDCWRCAHSSADQLEAEAHFQREHGGASAQAPQKAQRPRAANCDDIFATEIVLTQEQMTEAVLRRRRSERYARALYKCEQCFKSFSTRQTREHHMQRHDPAWGAFQCDICKLRHRTRKCLVKHIRSLHWRMWRCGLCPNVAYNRSFALSHYHWHTGIRFDCPVCGESFLRKSTMLSHLRLKHPSGHVCAQCGESFVSQQGLRAHVAKTHPEAPASWLGPRCEQCAVRFASRRAWTRHVLLSGGHDRLAAQIRNGCARCGETFGSARELREHAAAEHPQRVPPGALRRLFESGPQPCPQCGELMPSPVKLSGHFRRAHPGQHYPYRAPYTDVCEVCGKSFKCKALLKMHMHRHTGSPQFKCSECPKAFYNPLCLRMHLSTHSDERPCVCDICGATFKLKGNLDRHMTVHTGVKPFVCGECGRGFACMHWTRHHIRTVHNGEHVPSKPRVRRRGAERARRPAGRVIVAMEPAAPAKVVRLSDVIALDMRAV